MHKQASVEHPRARTLIHPGPFNPVRIQSRQSARARHIRLALEPGVSLFDGLVRPLAEAGIENASTTILGGSFERLTYCVAPPDPTRQALIAYSAPIEAGPTYLVFGNATIGKNQRGEPIVHCHGCFRTSAGATRGGHIIADDSIVGASPISVLVTSLDGFELRVAFDPETNIPLIQPHEVAA